MPTKRFNVSPFTLGFTHNVLRSILDMTSSRKTKISWLKNLMRAGLVAKWILGILDLSLPVKDESSVRFGSTAFTVTSRGPGTKTKCVERKMTGYEAIRSASASKFSAER